MRVPQIVTRVTEKIAKTAGKVAQKANLNLIDIFGMQKPDMFVKASQSQTSPKLLKIKNAILAVKVFIWSIIGKAANLVNKLFKSNSN